jgi:hypothetical protein
MLPADEEAVDRGLVRFLRRLAGRQASDSYQRPVVLGGKNNCIPQQGDKMRERSLRL